MRTIKLSDDEQGIGTSTRLLLCGELEDDIVGTSKEINFLGVFVRFMRRQFPFSDNSIKQLAFLGYRDKMVI